MNNLDSESTMPLDANNPFANPKPEDNGMTKWIAIIIGIACALALGYYFWDQKVTAEKYRNSPVLIVAHNDSTYTVDLLDGNECQLPNGQTKTLANGTTYIYNDTKTPLWLRNNNIYFASDDDEKDAKTKQYTYAQVDKYLADQGIQLVKPGQGFETTIVPSIISWSIPEEFINESYEERQTGPEGETYDLGFFDDEAKEFSHVTTTVIYVKDKTYTDTTVAQPLVMDGKTYDLAIGQKTIINASKRKLVLFDVPYGKEEDMDVEFVNRLTCRYIEPGDTVYYSDTYVRRFSPVSEMSISLGDRKIDTYLDYADTKSAKENVLSLLFLKATYK